MSSTARQYLDPTALRALGYDLIALALFTTFARLAHRDARGFSLATWADTLWPFLVGLVFGYAVLHFLRANPRLHPLRLAPGVVIWLCAVAGGLTIWGLRHGHVPHISFVLVATTMLGLLCLGWRLIARLLRRH